MINHTPHSWLKSSCLYIGIVFLAACSTLQQPTAPEPQTEQLGSETTASPEDLWRQQRQRSASLTQWAILGKLGIRTPADSVSARINWQQADPLFQIRLSSLLGQGAVMLSGTPNNIVLNMAGRDEIHTSQPEQLLFEELGWTLPIKALPHWVRGIPAPGSYSHLAINNQGQLSELSQSGWSLQFVSYQTVDDFSLPRKILLERGDIKLTLIAKEWSQLIRG